jgi:hypothetical protein
MTMSIRQPVASYTHRKVPNHHNDQTTTPETTPIDKAKHQDHMATLPLIDDNQKHRYTPNTYRQEGHHLN